MPRLSLFKPERGRDYKYIDDRIFEMFTMGGTDIHMHKLLGGKPTSADDATPTTPVYDENSVTNIQDLLLLETRDRKYEEDVYTLRAIYNLQDLEFNLSQFGMFLNNDMLFMTVHMHSTVKTIGRKPVIGDVIELPHLRDEYALNDKSYALKQFYVIEEVTRPAEGYSPTWYPHLYRFKLKLITDGQEFKDIDKDSELEKILDINDAVLQEAEEDAQLSGYDTQHFYTLSTDENGNVCLIRADTHQIDASNTHMNVGIDDRHCHPLRNGYQGYLLGDGIPPNGNPFGCGQNFPEESQQGDYFLRTDMFPNRLFLFNGKKWKKVEDNVRMTLNNTDDRLHQKGTFINNTNTNEICGDVIPERQSLSEALRPKVDMPNLSNPENCDSSTPGNRS
jgi:hypothetical protein